MIGCLKVDQGRGGNGPPIMFRLTRPRWGGVYGEEGEKDRLGITKYVNRKTDRHKNSERYVIYTYIYLYIPMCIRQTDG